MIARFDNLGYQGLQGFQGTNTSTHVMMFWFISKSTIYYLFTLQHTNIPTHSNQHSDSTSLEKVWPSHLLTM